MSPLNMAKYDECATEEYRVETKTSEKRCRRWPVVVVLTILVIICIVAVVVVVIHTRHQSSVDHLQVDRITAVSSVKILNRNFTATLNDSETDEYQELETAFIRAIGHVFATGSLANSYNSTSVNSFRSGSVHVFFDIILANIPSELMAQPLTRHNQEKTRRHIRHILKSTILSRVGEAERRTGIKLDVNSLIIHEVILHDALNAEGKVKGSSECRIPTEDEYIYLKEGEVVNLTSACFPEVVEIGQEIAKIFIAPPESRIKVTFSEFRYDDGGEFLYLGSATEPAVVGTFIARFTGYDLPPDMMSAANGLWLRGWSFGDTVSGVFVAQISAIKEEHSDFECKEGTYPCKYALTCFSEAERCTGDYTCPSGTDEIGCDCYPPLSYFKCSDGRCLDRQYICNGPQGCADDEAHCAFTCPNGKNVTEAFICDGFNDCGDYADERQNCSCNQPNQWQCADGACIFQNNVCDGFPHCTGGDDERNCGCQSWQFECGGDGSCIPYWDRCDGNDTCADNSDEQNCPKCPGKLFQCASFQCISKSAVCDGEADCYDGDDEQNCPTPKPCAEGEFRCQDGVCLRASLKCDDVPQCMNGTDEVNCGQELEACDFSCDDGECIPESWICDGVDDCLDGEDEPNCEYNVPEPCEDGLFRCPDRQCIPENLLCNGIRDCQGNADELNCTSIQDRCRNMTAADYFICDGKKDCPEGVDESSCEVCGRRPGRNRKKRMLGGREVTSTEWPWQIYMAAENDTESVSCGGAILNRRWILTAAHCISAFQIGLVVIVTGSSNRFVVGTTQQVVQIDDVYEHPDFVYNGYYLLYDAALVLLAEPLTIMDDARAVCLPDVGFRIDGGTYLTSTGFGETGAGSLSSNLMEIRLPVIPTEVCVRWTEHDLDAASKVICVGYEQGVQGPCYGDSGSPLVVEKDGSWYVVGIVSGGAQCGAPYTPNFYTRVTKILDWIDDVIHLR